MNLLTRQLIRASLPAQRVIKRRRLGRTVLEETDGLSLVVLPDVFNGVVFRSGVFLARTAAEYLSALPTPPAQTGPGDRPAGDQPARQREEARPLDRRPR